MQCMNWSLSWTDSNDSQLIRDYFLRFLYQPRDREYPDLCQLPDLTEQTLLENLKVFQLFFFYIIKKFIPSQLLEKIFLPQKSET